MARKGRASDNETQVSFFLFREGPNLPKPGGADTARHGTANEEMREAGGRSWMRITRRKLAERMPPEMKSTFPI